MYGKSFGKIESILLPLVNIFDQNGSSDTRWKRYYVKNSAHQCLFVRSGAVRVGLVLLVYRCVFLENRRLNAHLSACE